MYVKKTDINSTDPFGKACILKLPYTLEKQEKLTQKQDITHLLV